MAFPSLIQKIILTFWIIIQKIMGIFWIRTYCGRRGTALRRAFIYNEEGARPAAWVSLPPSCLLGSCTRLGVRLSAYLFRKYWGAEFLVTRWGACLV